MVIRPRNILLACWTLTIVVTSGCASKKWIRYVEDGVVNIDDLGARSNGRFDNARLIQRALDIPGVQEIKFGSGEYFISQPIVIQNSAIKITGTGVGQTKITGRNTQLLDVRSVARRSQPYSESIEQGASRLTIRNAQTLAPGDIVHLSSTRGMRETTSGGYTSHYVSRINRIDGDVVHLEQATEIPFSQNTRVQVFNASTFALSDLTLETNKTLYMATVANREQVEITNVDFVGADENFMGEYLKDPARGTSAIATYACHDVTVDSCKFLFVWYGLMAHNGCVNVSLTNSEARSSRHINNSGIGTRYFMVRDCKAYQCQGGFDSHETALHTVIQNCVDIDPLGTSKFRGRRDEVINSVFEGDVEFRTDPGLHDLARQPDRIFKKVSGSTIRGNTVLTAGNIDVDRCTFYGAVHPFRNSGDVVIRNSLIDVSQSTSTKTTALTMADGAADGTYQFKIENVEVIGPGEQPGSTFSIGVYLPMKNGASGEISGLTIDGFQKGLVLFGASKRYVVDNGLQARAVTLRNCQYGLFRSGDAQHPIELTDVRFENCIQRSNAAANITLKDNDGQ